MERINSCCFLSVRAHRRVAPNGRANNSANNSATGDNTGYNTGANTSGVQSPEKGEAQLHAPLAGHQLLDDVSARCRSKERPKPTKLAVFQQILMIQSKTGM